MNQKSQKQFWHTLRIKIIFWFLIHFGESKFATQNKSIRTEPCYEEKHLYLNDLRVRQNLRKSRRNIYADERRKILELNAAKKVFADKKSLNKKFAESQKSPMTSSLIPTIIGENDLQEISEEISSIRNIVGNLQNQIDLLISSQDNGQSIKDLLQKQHLEQQRMIFIKKYQKITVNEFLRKKLWKSLSRLLEERNKSKPIASPPR